MSVYEKVFDKLKEENFEVYPPNTHEGDCKSNYVVLLNGSKVQASGFSSQTVLIDVLCYVPGKRYTDMEPFQSNVKSTLESLFPLIIPTGTETQPFYDDTVKGWMVSIEYRYTVRNKQLR